MITTGFEIIHKLIRNVFILSDLSEYSTKICLFDIYDYTGIIINLSNCCTNILKLNNYCKFSLESYIMYNSEMHQTLNAYSTKRLIKKNYNYDYTSIINIIVMLDTVALIILK